MGEAKENEGENGNLRFAFFDHCEHHAALMHVKYFLQWLI